MLSDSFTSGLISGGLVALVQLGIAYLFLDRWVGKIQRETERSKWAGSRRELCANLLFLSHAASWPLSRYVIVRNNYAYPREGISQTLHYIMDLSRRLDALLAIYSNALPPEWFARVTQLADDLRSSGASALYASDNWEKIETQLESVPSGVDETPLAEIWLVREIAEIEANGRIAISNNPLRRRSVYFAWYTYRAYRSAIEAAKMMQAVAAENYELAELDETQVIKSNVGDNGRFDANYLQENTSRYLEIMEKLADAMKEHGFALRKQPEFD